MQSTILGTSMMHLLAAHALYRITVSLCVLHFHMRAESSQATVPMIHCSPIGAMPSFTVLFLFKQLNAQTGRSAGRIRLDVHNER